MMPFELSPKLKGAIYTQACSLMTGKRTSSNSDVTLNAPTWIWPCRPTSSPDLQFGFVTKHGSNHKKNNAFGMLRSRYGRLASDLGVIARGWIDRVRSKASNAELNLIRENWPRTRSHTKQKQKEKGTFCTHQRAQNAKLLKRKDGKFVQGSRQRPLHKHPRLTKKRWLG